jgi:hypothetical protein
MSKLLVILIAIVLVLWILGWISAHAGLMVIGVLGLGSSFWWKPGARGQLNLQRPERPDPGDVSRLGLEARGRTGSCQPRRSHAVDPLRERGPLLGSGLKITALADASALDLAVECQPPSPGEVTRWATGGRGGSEGLPLEERIEGFNQTHLIEEPPRCSCSKRSTGSEESPRRPILLHPNGGSQPLYLVERRSRSLDVGEGHDGCW